MAEAEIERVAAEAETRWPLIGVVAIHRFGAIRPGEQIVMVGAASAHRAAAFAAAEMLMDYLKTRAPFWKRARLTDGSSRAGSRPRTRMTKRRKGGTRGPIRQARGASQIARPRNYQKRHSGESRNPASEGRAAERWIPAFPATTGGPSGASMQ